MEKHLFKSDKELVEVLILMSRLWHDDLIEARILKVNLEKRSLYTTKIGKGNRFRGVVTWLTQN